MMMMMCVCVYVWHSLLPLSLFLHSIVGQVALSVIETLQRVLLPTSAHVAVFVEVPLEASSALGVAHDDEDADVELSARY